METLYAKLYDKYNTIKTQKESHLENLNRDQEQKFLDFVKAAEDMVDILKSDNNKLQGHVDELKRELASVRSSSKEKEIQYQELLEEVTNKNKKLSEEIAILLHQEHEDIRAGSGLSVRRSTRKRKLYIKEGASTPNPNVELDRQVEQNVNMDNDSEAPPSPSIQQPPCCRSKISSSGGSATDGRSVKCAFHYLTEFTLGMKLTLVTERNNDSILINHESNGYSFSLTWITNSKGESEIVYQVLSLGTLERMAPEWMKETVIFNINMWRMFLDRVSRVLKS